MFTHNAFHIGSDTELTVGIRYNDFSDDARQFTTGDFHLGSAMLPGGGFSDPIVTFEGVLPCVDGSANPCVTGESSSNEEWTGTVKLRHFFSEAFNLYGTLDRGFRPGAPNFDVSGIFQPDLNGYEGESVNSIEIGAKGDVFDGRARYTAAFFYSVYEDYQVPATFEAYNTVRREVGIARNAFVNVDEAVQAGIEADFRMMVTADWMIYTGFTYTSVEFTDGELPCTDPTQTPVGPDNRYNTCDADGERASSQPQLTALFQTEYTFPQLVGNSDGYLGGLWNYSGDTEVPGDTTGRLDSDSYSTLDLFAGLRSETWTAQLFAKNVTDEDGVLARAPTPFGYNEVTMISPRTYGITASYRF